MNSQTVTDIDPTTGNLPNIPTTWPDSATGSPIYKYSKQLVRPNWKPLLVLALLSLFLGSINNVDLIPHVKISTRAGAALGLTAFLLRILLGPAFIAATLDAVDSKPVLIGASIMRAVKAFFSLLIAQIIMGAIIIFGLILLVIPGLIFASKLYMTNYFIIDKGMGPIDALNASWNMTKGNKRRVFQLWSFEVLLAILVITIIGAPFSVYFWFMFSASGAILFRYLDKNSVDPAINPLPATQA